MSIQHIEWSGDDYGEDAKKLRVEFTSRTYFTDGSRADMRFVISHAGVGYNIHSTPSGSSHSSGAIGLSIENLDDLAGILPEYARKVTEMYLLRQGNPLEQLARTGQ